MQSRTYIGSKSTIVFQINNSKVFKPHTQKTILLPFLSHPLALLFCLNNSEMCYSSLPVKYPVSQAHS